LEDEIDLYLNETTKKLLNLLTDGIIITDKNGIVRFINESYSKYASLLPEDIVGRYLKEVRPGARLPEALQKRKALYNCYRKEGPVESYVDAIPILQDGKLIGGLASVRDTKTLKTFMNYLQINNERIRQQDGGGKQLFNAKYTFSDIIGDKSSKYIQQAKKAAANSLPVLISGESGSGKELIAQAIHNASSRADFPFVDINCGALPDTLLESELFGYSPGTFTGANKEGKIGLFEIANKGTIFLDEITEMPLHLQVKLLRVLQEKMVRRLGDNKNIPLNVKVIAATNKDIYKTIEQQQFREDLFFRLGVFIIDIPPLRDRKGDLPDLIQHFIAQQSKIQNRYYSITSSCLTFLQQYTWPGNIRELQNIIEFACYVTEDNLIDLDDLPNSLIKKNYLNAQNPTLDIANLKSLINKTEKSQLKRYLEVYGNSLQAKKRIAKELNISLATLYNKIKKYDIH